MYQYSTLDRLFSSVRHPNKAKMSFSLTIYPVTKYTQLRSLMICQCRIKNL